MYLEALATTGESTMLIFLAAAVIVVYSSWSSWWFSRRATCFWNYNACAFDLNFLVWLFLGSNIQSSGMSDCYYLLCASELVQPSALQESGRQSSVQFAQWKQSSSSLIYFGVCLINTGKKKMLVKCEHQTISHFFSCLILIKVGVTFKGLLILVTHRLICLGRWPINVSARVSR